MTDTIYALSSGMLPSGVAVVRISGPGAKDALLHLTGRLPEPRLASLADVRSGDGLVLDRALVLLFPGPASVTGEDVAELHLHGGRGTVSAVLSEIGSLAGMRPAEAGEFTRRAYLNDKMDLTEAEALSDLLSAETEAQRRFSLGNSQGLQKRLYESWRTRIIRARALIEAELDFSDEEDVPDSASSQVWADMAELAREIDVHVARFRQAEIIRQGYVVVITGEPNVGKSSLINSLARREVAIVSSEAGTTRDLIEVSLDLNGLKVIVVDTAGIRDDAGMVEQMGINRARARLAEANLVLELSTSGRWSEHDVPVIRVHTQIDKIRPVNESDVGVSVVTGEGIDTLLGMIGERARADAGSLADVLPARARHVDLLDACSREISRVPCEELEFSAEALRRAGDSLGRLTGRVDVEDLLDVIFSEFCVGK